jgi:hypothetical protein
MSPFSDSAALPALPAPGSADAAQTARTDRSLGRLSAAGIGTGLLIMVFGGLVRNGWMPPKLTLPAYWPPWQLPVVVSPKVVAPVLWVGLLLAAAGVWAGLLALHRRQPVPIRTILIAAAIGAAVLVVLPPVGSTDIVDYAIYGRIAALGHSPYVMTPAQWKALYHVSAPIPLDWAHDPSVYGPLATAEQFLAARLAGSSLALTTFFLKLVNLAAFWLLAFGFDRLLRGDRAARIRAHLLWTANPLVIWTLIGAGHLDVLAAGAGLAAVLIADRWAVRQSLPAAAAAAAAGICVGVATDIKAYYLLFGLAVAWALRRQPIRLLTAAAGAAAVLGPSYLAAGTAAVKAVASRAGAGNWYGFFEILHRFAGFPYRFAVPVAMVLLVPVVWLTLTRLPFGAGDRPAAQAALALGVAWLLVWPHQYAWYSVMIIVVLVIFPASRLDWIVLLWLSAMSLANTPGLGTDLPARHELGPVLMAIQLQDLDRVAPTVMLCALIAMIVLCLKRRWHAVGHQPGAGTAQAQATVPDPESVG